MNETLPLSHAAVQALTGKSRYSAQRRELDHMGVPYTKRRDGSPVVYMSGATVSSRKEPELRL
jgi:hypothetical protein